MNSFLDKLYYVLFGPRGHHFCFHCDRKLKANKINTYRDYSVFYRCNCKLIKNFHLSSLTGYYHEVIYKKDLDITETWIFWDDVGIKIFKNYNLLDNKNIYILKKELVDNNTNGMFHWKIVKKLKNKDISLYDSDKLYKWINNIILFT